MKKLIMFLSLSFVLLFAVACNDQTNNNGTEEGNQNMNVEHEAPKQEEDSTKETDATNEEMNKEENTVGNEDANMEKAENQEDMKAMLAQLDFYEMQVEVSYKNDQEFEVEIEHHSNGDIEAEVKDEINDKVIKDDLEAFNYIYPTAKKLNVSEDMTQQEAIDQVLTEFNLADDYTEIEIEFEFEDGKKISFEEEKK